MLSADLRLQKNFGKQVALAQLDSEKLALGFAAEISAVAELAAGIFFLALECLK